MPPSLEKQTAVSPYIFIVKIILVILLLIAFAYTMYLSFSDPKAVYSNTYSYIISTILITILMFVIALSLIDNLNITYVLIPIAVITVILISIFTYYNTNILGYIFSGYILSSFIIIFILVGLGILYKIISVQSFEGGWGGFIFNLIFYIPCLLVNLVEFLLNDYYSTPKTVFVLFLIEIVIILLYLYGIAEIYKYINKDSVNIIINPTFLNKTKTIDRTIVSQMMDDNKDSVMKPYQFSMSMWVYLNPPNLSETPQSLESNIFYYGDGTTFSFHPQLSYYIDGSTGFYKIRAGSIGDVDQTFNFEAPYQRWNNFVFSYLNNKMDVFINGNLVKTFDKYYINKTDSDVMVFGPDASLPRFTSNGLYGAICNVVYYKKPMDKNQIVTNYNMLSTNIPPIYGNMSLTSIIVV